MTLDIAKYLENLVKKEAKISHFNVKVQAGTAGSIQLAAKGNIQGSYGDSYLQDADYLIFFTKPDGWQTGDKKKLFDLVNRGLGKDANGMNENDFKEYVSKAPDADTDTDADATDDVDNDKSDAAKDDGPTNTLFLKITVK